jgi:hypothetical protein
MRSESRPADSPPPRSSHPVVRVEVGERVDPAAAEALWALILGAGPMAAADGAEGDGRR